MRTSFHPRRPLMRRPTSLRTATALSRLTRRRGCGCPLAGGTSCAVSQESTGSIKGFRGEAALHGPRGKRGTGECVFFLVHPLHRRSWRPFGDWDGSSSCVSLRMLLENFLSFALALFALEIWCFVSIVLVSGSHCSGVWVLLRSTKIGIFVRCLFFVGAILG